MSYCHAAPRSCHASALAESFATTCPSSWRASAKRACTSALYPWINSRSRAGRPVAWANALSAKAANSGTVCAHASLKTRMLRSIHAVAKAGSAAVARAKERLALSTPHTDRSRIPWTYAAHASIERVGGSSPGSCATGAPIEVRSRSARSRKAVGMALSPTTAALSRRNSLPVTTSYVLSWTVIRSPNLKIDPTEAVHTPAARAIARTSSSD